MELTGIQKEIVDTQGNLIVSASAGTGKTHTMVAKIAKEITENKDHRVIAAITFTIKAAKEINDRLSVDIGESFIGTNNSFAIEEVIKPFMKDYYGSSYDCEITTDYNLKFDTYQEGLGFISNDSILGSYRDSNKNFIFQLALNILTNSEVARLFLQAKYFKIYIDEYQDCDKDMNEFFMYLSDELDIDLFIVGDDKQSLYIWRGARPESFRKILSKETFSKIEMNDNFRSNKQIQNYSNLLFEETSNLYEAEEDLSNIILLNCNPSNWVEKVNRLWEPNKSTALLRFSNRAAELGANMLSDNGMEFKFIPTAPIEGISNDSAWIYFAIAQYIFIENYSVYDFIYDIPSGTDEDSKLKRKLQRKLEVISYNVSDEEEFKEKVSDLSLFLGYTAQEEDLSKLYQTISDKKYGDSFESDKYLHKSMTNHSSKGLQFEQVILFAEDFPLVDKEDWPPIKGEENFYQHYVAVTRAKSKLIIVNNGLIRSGEYLRNIGKRFQKWGYDMDCLLQKRQ